MGKLSSAEIVEKSRKFNLFSWSVQCKVNPVVVDTAEGIYLRTPEGKEFIDLSSQLVNANIGHQHPKAVAAIKEQADKLTFAAPSFATEEKAICAEKIIDLMPDNFGKCFFTNAGAEANENAIKMARYFTGKNKIIARYRSYHGATMGAITLTGDPRRWPTEPGMPGVIRAFDPYCYRCPFGKEYGKCSIECATHVEEIIEYEGAGTIAAMIIESSVGSNGLFPAPQEYYDKLRAILTKHKILLIADEVMSGWGRTGKNFCFENYGYKPDIVTTAKGLTGGYVPLGVVVVSTEIADYFEDKMLSCGLTFSGHTLCVATASAVIDIYKDENLIEKSAKMGEYVGKRLNELKDKHPSIGDVRGLGLFWGIEFVKNRETKEMMCPFGGGASPMDELNKNLGARGIIVLLHWNVLMFCPPLVITKEEIDKIIDILDEEIKVLDAHVK